MEYLPPTSNVLEHEQRMRLMKSTRKLGAVLGTTPRLLEPVGSRPSLDSSRSPSPEQYPSRSSSRASHRSARIYSASSSVLSFRTDSDSDEYYHDTDDTSPESSPTDSVQPKPVLTLSAELPSKSSKKAKFLEPSLFLRLNGVTYGANPSASMSSLASAESDLRTAVPGGRPPLSPISPVSPNPEVSVLDMKRRKMAKLARTLGENVPPELVFGASNGTTKKVNHRMRSNSVDERRLSLSPRHASFSKVDVSTSRAREPSQLYQTVEVGIPSDITKYQHKRGGSDSRPAQPTTSAGLRRQESKRVKGREYSGEWNHEMEDVMQKLRGLRS